MALAYPSYFLSLISSNRNSCTRRQWGESNISHAKFKEKLHFIFNNSPVHFTLDGSWCLFHNCGIWGWNVKVALLQELSDAWVPVALPSLPSKFHTPWWRGIWILPEIFYWCNTRLSTGHFFSLHPHILQNCYFPCQDVTVSWGSVQCVTELFTSSFPPWLNFTPLCPLAHSLSLLKVVSWLQDMQLWPL